MGVANIATCVTRECPAQKGHAVSWQLERMQPSVLVASTPGGLLWLDLPHSGCKAFVTHCPLSAGFLLRSQNGPLLALFIVDIVHPLTHRVKLVLWSASAIHQQFDHGLLLTCRANNGSRTLAVAAWNNGPYGIKAYIGWCIVPPHMENLVAVAAHSMQNVVSLAGTILLVKL